MGAKMSQLRQMNTLLLPDATPTRDLHRRIDDEIMKTRTTVKDIERALESTPGAGASGGGQIFGSPAWFQSLDPEWKGLDTYHHQPRWDTPLRTPERQVIRKQSLTKRETRSPSPPSTRPNHPTNWNESTIAGPSTKYLIQTELERQYSPTYGGQRLKSGMFYESYNQGSYTRENEDTRLTHRLKALEGSPVSRRQHLQDRLHEKYQIPKYTPDVYEDPPSPAAHQLQLRAPPVPPFDARDAVRRPKQTTPNIKSASRAVRRQPRVPDPKDLSTKYFRALAKAEPDDTVRPTITRTGLFAH